MTYRQKLLLRRLLVVLAIVAAIVFAVFLVGFTYLGRYVIYTEDGAYFSFHTPSPSATAQNTVEPPSSIELMMGEPISTNEVLGEVFTLEDTDVRGVLVDYNTLKTGTTLNQVQLGDDSNNVLVMEMRGPDQPLLNSQPIETLIQRAKSQNVWLVAMISCLSDSDYAKENLDEALRLSGGALWMGSEGTYWLDPGNEKVISYLADIIQQLSAMGFNEVIIRDFYLPSSDNYTYNFDRTAAEIVIDAYNNLLDATMDYCALGLVIENPNTGHQAYEAADRVYVYYNEGSSVREYAEAHRDQFLVFMTDSHDTRFDDYGKIQISGDYTVDPDSLIRPVEIEDTTEDEDTDE